MASIKSFSTCLAMCSMMFVLNLDGSEGREFWVGGKENAWGIPPSPNQFNDWAGKQRFRIGDSLLLKYDPNLDSVLQVSEEDYQSCNKAKPIKEYRDGSTKIKLDESGPFFFISGADGHCEKGQKLEVKVLSHKHSSVPSPAPDASPAGFSAPAPAPKTASGAAAGLSTGVIMGIATMVVGSLVALAIA